MISDKGGRPINQDYTIAFESKNGILMILCDGMGGAKGGEVASKLVAEFIINEYKKFNGNLPIKEFLIDAIQSANRVLLETANSSSELSGMKTTIALAHILERRVIFIHVGDSRIYLFKKGNLKFRSKDHSKVQQLVDQGKLKAKKAIGHPESNVITRAIGGGVSCLMEIKSYKLAARDLIFLTSDGIHGSLTDFRIRMSVLFSNSVSEVVKKLSDSATNYGQKNLDNKHDNLSIIAFSRKFTNFGMIYLFVIIIFIVFLFSVNVYLSRGNVKIESVVNSKIDTVYLDKSISVNELTKFNFMDSHSLYFIKLVDADSLKKKMFLNVGHKLIKIDSINFKIQCQ